MLLFLQHSKTQIFWYNYTNKKNGSKSTSPNVDQWDLFAAFAPRLQLPEVKQKPQRSSIGQYMHINKPRRIWKKKNEKERKENIHIDTFSWVKKASRPWFPYWPNSHMVCGTVLKWYDLLKLSFASKSWKNTCQ